MGCPLAHIPKCNADYITVTDYCKNDLLTEARLTPWTFGPQGFTQQCPHAPCQPQDAEHVADCVDYNAENR